MAERVVLVTVSVLPLKEIAIEHLKVTTSWPLPRGELLLPNYDRGDGYLVDSPVELDLVIQGAEHLSNGALF